MADARKAAKVLSTDFVDKPKPRGHQLTYAVPKKAVAEAIGVATTTLVEAEQHVEDDGAVSLDKGSGVATIARFKS